MVVSSSPVAVTNNTYLKSNDPKKLTKYITYLHKNNLYGCAMLKFLPTDRFKCLNPGKLNLDRYENDSLGGCVLGIDLEYPTELHELLNDYLLAPHELETERKMLSDYHLKIADDYKLNANSSTKKNTGFITKTCNFI